MLVTTLIALLYMQAGNSDDSEPIFSGQAERVNLNLLGRPPQDLCPRLMYCQGLWVAPDRSSVAFVARTHDDQDQATIFVAKREDDYLPKRIPL